MAVFYLFVVNWPKDAFFAGITDQVSAIENRFKSDFAVGRNPAALDHVIRQLVKIKG
jgi:hypothetical protein